MTDLDMAILILGSLQAIQTAWLSYQTNRNACGGTKCQETMIAALKLTTARLKGVVPDTQQSREDARWHSPES